MKLFAFLAFVGIAAASFSSHDEGLRGHLLKWEDGMEYTYSYSGRLLTGIPELSSHQFSGIGIKCEIRVQVIPRSAGRRLALQIRDPRYTRVNEHLNPKSGDQRGYNWRFLQLPSYEPVPSESARLLSKPAVFEVSESSGKVVSLRMSGEEPEWSINFKKAIVALLQTGSVNPASVKGIKSLESRSGETIPMTWTNYEESPEGECETKYEMIEVPQSMAINSDVEGEKLIPKLSLCPSAVGGERSKIYQLTKTRNLDNCVRSSFYKFYQPGHITCPGPKGGRSDRYYEHGSYHHVRGGSCGGLWSRSSITRYNVCGSPDRFLIQSIVNEGETNQQLMQFKTEKILTGTRQVLKLLNKSPVQSNIEGELSGSDQVEHKTLIAKFSKKGVESQQKDMSSIIYSFKSGHKINKEELIRKTEELVKEIVESDLFNVQGLPKTDMSFKVLSLSWVFRTFDRTMLQKVYENVVQSRRGSEKSEIYKSILVDTIVMSGTPESIKFFKHLIERNELPHSQIAALFFNLPRTIITPNSYLLEELFELVKSEQVKSKHYVWSSAILAMSSLLEKACISPNSRYTYPTEVFGKFCHKESAIVTEKWIPYLERLLSETRGSSSPRTDEKRNTIIVALGLMSHEQVLPVLLPILEEESYISGEHSHLSKYLGVYSLLSVGRYHPHRVLPVVSAIYSNRAEPTDIRIAAFHVLMNLRPDMTLLQKIATMTWYERDTEVLRTVNTAFYTLANEVSMQDYKTETSVLIRRARLVYPLIKKTGGRFPSSASIYNNAFLDMLKVGYERVNNWVASEDSVIPSYFYDKITLFMGEEYKFTPFELGLHMRDVIPNLYDTVSGTASSSVEEIKSKLTHEWRETIDKLRIKIRENRTPETYIFLRIFEDSTLFHSLSRSGGEEIARIVRNPHLLKQYMSGEKKFNYQRVFDLSPMESVVPSEIGLPVYMTLRMPTVLSFRGYFNSDAMSQSLYKFDLTFETIVDKRLTGVVGTVCPFTGDFLLTGVDQHSVLNLPFNWRLKFDLPDQKLVSSISLTNAHSSSGPMDLIYYKIRPFTAIQKMSDLRPVFKVEGFKPIRSRSKEQTKEFMIGEGYGLGLKFAYKTETPYLGLRYVLEKASNYHYNPLNYFRFHSSAMLGLTTTGLPSVRRHEARLVYEGSSSSVKEIDFVLKWGYASKEKNQPIKYHKLEPSDSRLVKMVTKTLGEDSAQERRQRNIKNLFERMQVDSEGRAFTITVSTALKGTNRPISSSYSATFGTGSQGIHQKWDMHVQSEHSSKQICVKGVMRIPPYSIWKLNEIRSEDPVFHFRNEIGYGRDCESKVVFDGYAKTSEKQKRQSAETPEAKEYERLLRKGTPMIKLSELAETVRRQASVLDVYSYKIKYVNVGETVTDISRRVLEGLQFYWMPYYRFQNEHSGIVEAEQRLSSEEEMERRSMGVAYGSENFVIDVLTRIHPDRRTFSVQIVNETNSEQKYTYEDVPLPYPFDYMYPISYIHDPVTMSVKGVTGKSTYPICTLEGRHLTTFDNRTIKADIDDCFHLLSGDCSKSMQYGVLVRSLSTSSYAESEKEIKVLLPKTDITMRPEGGDIVKIKVNGNAIEVPKSERKPIKSHEGHIVAEVIRTKDNVLVLKSSKISVYFDGKKVKLEGSNLLKNKLCGLCGDNNNKKFADILSPRKCVLSKPELEVASYRIGSLPSKQCRPLPENIKSQLVQETERCVKPTHKSTRISESYRNNQQGGVSEGECMRHHHEIVDKYSRHEYCFSRIPILECGHGCHPVGLREKTVSFTCMPKDRRSEHIAEKIREGQVLPELRNFPESYSVQRTVPVECKPYHSYGSTTRRPFDF